MTKPKRSAKPPVGIPGYTKGGVTKGKKGKCPHCGMDYAKCKCKM